MKAEEELQRRVDENSPTRRDRNKGVEEPPELNREDEDALDQAWASITDAG
jgi:hypothetical protein